MLAVEYIFIYEKLKPRLTFNPGLALTAFRTTRPWSVVCNFFPLVFSLNFTPSLESVFYPLSAGCILLPGLQSVF